MLAAGTGLRVDRLGDLRAVLAVVVLFFGERLAVFFVVLGFVALFLLDRVVVAGLPLAVALFLGVLLATFFCAISMAPKPGTSSTGATLFPRYPGRGGRDVHYAASDLSASEPIEPVCQSLTDRATLLGEAETSTRGWMC